MDTSPELSRWWGSNLRARPSTAGEDFSLDLISSTVESNLCPFLHAHHHMVWGQCCLWSSWVCSPVRHDLMLHSLTSRRESRSQVGLRCRLFRYLFFLYSEYSFIAVHTNRFRSIAICRSSCGLSSFTADDAKELSALCSHISVALENIKRADEADLVSMAG